MVMKKSPPASKPPRGAAPTGQKHTKKGGTAPAGRPAPSAGSPAKSGNSATHPAASRQSGSKTAATQPPRKAPRPHSTGEKGNKYNPLDSTGSAVGIEHRGPAPLRVGAVSARYLQAGHCWVTRDRELGDTSRYRMGDLVDLVGPDGAWLAKALIEPDARVVARVLGWDKRESYRDEALQARALEALGRRASLQENASAYRVIHGEADGFPGLTIDRYGDALVAQLYTPAALGLAHLALDALMQSGQFRGAFLKPLPRDRRQADASSTSAAGHWIAGDPCPASFTIHEYGVRFHVQPFSGLSTGIFLDMRENRRMVAELVAGMAMDRPRVLNTFSYTGGFSVTCALKGAQVDTLDLSGKAIEQARENFRLNDLPVGATSGAAQAGDGHHFMTEDAFPYLARMSGRYDMIILDPPTFSTSKENTWSPGRITELNALALSALKPNGWLVTFSNYAQMKEEELQSALRLAGIEAHRRIQVVHALQAGLDFPWLPGFPESRHLKGFVVRVSG